MSRAKAAVGLFRQILRRMDDQPTLESATQQVSKRSGAHPLVKPEVPEDLSLAVEGAQGEKPIVPRETPLDTGQPFSRDEYDRVMEASGTEILDDPVTNLNFRRIETEEDISGLLTEMMRVRTAHGEGLSGKRTFKQIEIDAENADIDEIRRKLNAGERLEDFEQTKLREVEATLLNSLKKRGDELLDLEANGQLTEQMEYDHWRAMEKTAAIAYYVGNESRKTAQALSAHRITVSSNPYISNLERQRFLELANSGRPFKNVLESISAQNTPAGIRNALDDRKGNRIYRFLGNVWYNAVLAKFAVAKAFLGGATVNKLVFPLETGLAHLAGRARKAFGDDFAAQPAINRSVTGGEFIIELSGIFQGFKDSVAPIMKHLNDPNYDLGPSKFERQVRQDTTLHGNYGGKGKARDVVYQVIDAAFQNGSFRLMKMNDFAARSISFQQRVKSLAYRVATHEGKEGDELVSRMNELMRDMPDEFFSEAHHAGGVATMTQELWPMLQKIERGFFQNVPGLRFFAPFTRTMFAMFQAGVERTPIIAHLSPDTRAAWAKGGAERDKVIGKQMLGMGLMGMGAFAAANGEATSGAALPDHERRGLFKSGWRPNALVDKDGDYWSMQFASPAAEIFFFGAALYEMSKYINAGVAPTDPRYKDWDSVFTEVFTGSAWLFADITLNRSIGVGVLELLEALSDPGMHGEKKIVSTTAPFFQFFGGAHITRAMDPTRRRTPEGNLVQELVDTIKKNTPGLSDDLPPAVGFFGENKHPWNSMLDVFSYSPQDPNVKLWEQLYMNGVNVENPSKVQTIAGSNVNLDLDILPEHFRDSEIRENPEMGKRGYAYYRYSQIRGEIYKDVLKELFKSPEYKNKRVPYGEASNTDAAVTKGDLIATALRSAESIARAEFHKELKRDMKGFKQEVQRIRQERQPVEGKFIPPGVKKLREKQEQESRERDERRKAMRESVNF